MGNVDCWIYLTICLCLQLSSYLASEASISACVKECSQSVYSSHVQSCTDAKTDVCSRAIQPEPTFSALPSELTSLNVKDLGDRYGLIFSWKATEGVSSYLVTLSQYEKFTISANRTVKTVCKNVAVNKSQDSENVFEDSCWEDLQPGTNYSIHLLALPNMTSLNYFFKTPNDFSKTFNPYNLENWEGLVGLAAARINKTSHLYVVFQEAPAKYNISSYRVSMSDDINVESKSIHVVPNSASYPATYTRVAMNKEDTLVFATIRPMKCTKEMCLKGPYTRNTSPNITVLGHRNDVVKRVVEDTTTAQVTTTFALPTDPDMTRRNVTIVVSVVCAVAVAGIIIGLICFLKRKKQCCFSGSFPMQRFRNQEDNESHFALDIGFRRVPTVLILYSYDCEAHESVIVEFASYLKHVFHCDVSMDIWEQAEIQSRGAYDWIKEKLNYCQYVVIVCSVGARFKCVRNKQFSVKETRPVPDIFQDAVDLVAENIRCLRENGSNASKFIVTYFEYSRKTDIPPKLDTVDFYFLMNDILRLYCHIYGLSRVTNHYKSYHGLSPESYKSTETGKQLCDAISKANQFFKNNPNWLGDTLEPLIPPSPQTQPPPNDYKLLPVGPTESGSDPVSESLHDSPSRSAPTSENLTVKNGHSRVSSTSLSVASEEDSLIDERRRKRQKELIGSLDRMKNGKPRIRYDSLDSAPNDSPNRKVKLIKNGHVQLPMQSELDNELDVSVSVGGSSPEHYVSTNGNEHIPHKLFHSAFSVKPNFAEETHTGINQDDDSFVDDDLQLQKDIDHIQNYDIHLRVRNLVARTEFLISKVPFSPQTNHDCSENGVDNPTDSEGSVAFSNQLYDLHMGPETNHYANGMNNNCIKSNMNDNNNVPDNTQASPWLSNNNTDSHTGMDGNKGRNQTTSF